MQPNGIDNAPVAAIRNDPSSAFDGVLPECKYLFARVKAGLLADLNYTNDSMIEMALYPRQTVTDPSFLISLHERAADSVRWLIMDTGSYCEYFITRHSKFVFGQTHGGIRIDVGMNIGWFSL
jgi:hypothetical protein